MGDLTCRASAWLNDWYVIERDDGRRVGGADVEGTAVEMLEVATAIEDRRGVSFTRCAVRVRGQWVDLWSPRNSLHPTEVSLVQADALARRIRETVKTPAEETGR